MTLLSEYIHDLKKLLESHGDRAVVQALPYGPFEAFTRDVKPPTLHSVKLPSKREQYEKIAFVKGDPRSGEEVYRL